MLSVDYQISSLQPAWAGRRMWSFRVQLLPIAIYSFFAISNFFFRSRMVSRSYGERQRVLEKAIIGIMLAAAVAIWLFARGEISGIIIVLGIAAFAIGAALKKKNTIQSKRVRSKN